MAAKLQDKNSNVAVLRPRKAKGSKSTGGRKPANRLKPRAGEEAPAIPPQPSDADVRRATQDRLVALHQRHRGIEGKMSAAQEVLSTLREEKQQIRASIQNTCVPLAIYDEVHGKVTKKTTRSDNQEYENQRALAFEAFGLPIGPEAQLDYEKIPQAARPGVHWTGQGYLDGVNGLPCDPKAAGCPPENIQDYNSGFSDAMERNARGIKTLDAPDAPKAPKGAKPKAKTNTPDSHAEVAAQVVHARAEMAKGNQPAWNGFPVDLGQWHDDHIQVFTDWFNSLPEDAEVDVKHVGAAAMFDKLCDAQETPEKGTFGAEAEEDVHTGPAPKGVIYMLNSEEPFVSGRQATYLDGKPEDTGVPGEHPYYDSHPEDFEASEDELQAQGGRRAIQERRAAEQENGGFSD